jgi:hypothetical protein
LGWKTVTARTGVRRAAPGACGLGPAAPSRSLGGSPPISCLRRSRYGTSSRSWMGSSVHIRGGGRTPDFVRPFDSSQK